MDTEDVRVLALQNSLPKEMQTKKLITKIFQFLVISLPPPLKDQLASLQPYKIHELNITLHKQKLLNKFNVIIFV